MKECWTSVTMRCHDILSRHCCRPGSSPFLFVVLRALILDIFNPLPYMSILGSSNTATNKDKMSKIWTDGDTLSN